MYLFRIAGDVWQIGDDSDLLFWMVIRFTLFMIVLSVAVGFLALWLAFKLVQLCFTAPKIGLPLAGAAAAGAIVLASAA